MHDCQGYSKIMCSEPARSMLRAIDLSPLAVAKRLGSHGENALADINRRSLPMRLAKLRFRIHHVLEGGLMRPKSMDWECFGFDQKLHHRLTTRPKLGA